MRRGWSLMLLVLTGGMLLSCAPPTVQPFVETPAPAVISTPPIPASLTMEMLRNAMYQSPDGSGVLVRLENGSTKIPGARTMLIEETVAFGDLDGDEAEDAAGILLTEGDGTGSYRGLFVLLNRQGRPGAAAFKNLGDRVIVSSVTIRSKTIVVEGFVHGPNDALCCPSAYALRSFRLHVQESMRIDESETP